MAFCNGMVYIIQHHLELSMSKDIISYSLYPAQQPKTFNKMLLVLLLFQLFAPRMHIAEYKREQMHLRDNKPNTSIACNLFLAGAYQNSTTTGYTLCARSNPANMPCVRVFVQEKEGTIKYENKRRR